jgi:AraC-like DNA-binding protein/quercetin dioxygenase-like cupin family protein
MVYRRAAHRGEAPQSYAPTSSGSASVTSVDDGSLRISRVAFAPGVLPTHYHERACVSVVLDGSFTEHIGGRAIECRRGGVLLKPAGEPHRDEFAGSVQIIVEPDEDSAVILGEREDLFRSIAYTRSPIASAIAARIAREFDQADAFTRLAVKGLTLELLVDVLRAGRGPSPSARAADWLARVREQIDDSGPVPEIARLAADAQVNPAYLARTFRRRYGVSIGQYARQIRLDWVARQLVETSEPLSAIAFRAGFADQSHLTRAFRARWGVTPGQYRLAASSRTEREGGGTS